MSEPTRLAVARLSAAGRHDFDLRPDADARAALAGQLGALAIRKLRLTGSLRADGSEWRLEATLGATVVQPCVVTLEPVTTRIDQPVLRRFVPAERFEAPPGSETEMPEDDSLEPLGSHFDLDAVMAEALALAMPAYPRADDAGPGDAVAAPKGAAPLTDEAVRPFAGLAALRDRMGWDDGTGEDGSGNGGQG